MENKKDITTVINVQPTEARAPQAEATGLPHQIEVQASDKSSARRLTKPLRAFKTAVRALIGRTLRLAVRKGKALARRVPVVKQAALWLLRRSPWLMRLASRFSDSSISAALVQQKPIRHFEELRSVRIMQALSQLPALSSEGSVTFLEVSDDVR